MSNDATPAAAGIPAGHFPGPPVVAGHVEPCPRRIRAHDGHGWAVDTVEAFYVWEHPFYPQYAVPGEALPGWLRARARPVPPDERLHGYVILTLDADTAWFEEDEPVRGHPRNPYVRVDAVRSGRTVTVTAEGRELARSSAPVGVFETGLPPRWYLDRTCVDWSLLTPSDTRTHCPYKGVTSDYWSAGAHADVAWSYGAPRAAVSLVAGLVAFDDTVVEVDVRRSTGEDGRHGAAGAA